MGTYQAESGTLVVSLSDDANGYVVADAVRLVEVTPATTTPTIVDNADAAFAETGSDWLGWSSSDNYGGGCRYAPPAGTGSNTASWTFSPPPVGTYQVYATWNAAGNHASNAAYTVLDGGTPLSTVYVDQQTAPDDLVADGQGWASLGVYAIHQGVLTVQISDSGANGYVAADAVRIEKVDLPLAVNDSYTSSEDTPRAVGPAPGLLANDDWGLSVTGWSLDLKDHCIVFPKPAGDDGQTAAAVQQLVNEGMGSDGLWTGTTGLYSSTAAAADAVPGGPRMGILTPTRPTWDSRRRHIQRRHDPGLRGDHRAVHLRDRLGPRRQYRPRRAGRRFPAGAARPVRRVAVDRLGYYRRDCACDRDRGGRRIVATFLTTTTSPAPNSSSYTVTNQATGATSTADVTVQVQDVPPVVGITGLPGGEAPAGVPIALGSAVTGPGSGGAFIYSWDVTKLAAGTTTEHFATGTAAQSFTFTPNEEGTYTVQLVVTDAAGGTGQAQAVIEDSQIQTLYWDADGNNSQNTGGTENSGHHIILLASR